MSDEDERWLGRDLPPCDGGSPSSPGVSACALLLAGVAAAEDVAVAGEPRGRGEIGLRAAAAAAELGVLICGS